MEPGDPRMNFGEGKARFVEAWGKLGTNWGISKAMAQVHALLLIRPDSLCSDQVMEELGISRGCANMSLRSLMDWGLVYKESKPGDRKEYFRAEKDMWHIFRQVVHHRKKKELDPMIECLDDLSKVQGLCSESKEFCQMVGELRKFSVQASRTLDHLEKAESRWFMQSFINMI